MPFVLLLIFSLFSGLVLAKLQYVYVYDGPGVAPNALMQARNTLHTALGDKYVVQSIGYKQLASSEWMDNAALLVMPGGADLPYVKYLRGQANINIKRYVANGGSYLGICAGAYYAGAMVEFDRGGPLQVVGKRELALFPGKVVGPIFGPYHYDSYQGVRVVRLLPAVAQDSHDYRVYYNGGGYFAGAKAYPGVKILFNYSASNQLYPAIIQVRYQQGRVILSGVHFEFAPDKLVASDQYLRKIKPLLVRHEYSRRYLVNSVLCRLRLNTQLGCEARAVN